MGEAKGTIRRKISIVLLAVGMLILGISVCISIAGMRQTIRKSKESSRKLGNKVEEDTKDALIRMTENSLRISTKEMSALSNEKLVKICENVELLAGYLSDIYQNPNNYGSIHFDVLGQESKGNAVLQFDRMKEIAYEDVKQEAEKAGMFYETAKHIFEINKNSISSVYFGSASGFMVSYDDKGDKTLTLRPEERMLPAGYNITEREWYKMAESKGKATLIETYGDSLDKSLILTCSAPVWSSSNELAGVIAIDIKLKYVCDEIISSKIGENGFAILIGQSGQIISGPGMGEDSSGDSLESITSFSPDMAEELKHMQDGKTGFKETTIDNKEYYMAYSPVPVSGWTLAVLVPKDEIIKPALDSSETIEKETQNTMKELEEILRHMVFIFVAVSVGLMAGVFLLTIRMSDKIAGPIKKLTTDVRRISSGDLDYRTDIKTGDEIELLGDAFNSMTGSLKNYIMNYAKISAEKERIATELGVAASIQKNMLPEGKVVREEFELFAVMNPAKEVGGDFYDYFKTEDGGLWIVIADVSGKGVPAALFMVIAKTLLKNQANHSSSPGEVLKTVNNQLCEHNETEMFVTAFIARYDFEKKIMECANAGHNQPLISKKGEGFQWLSLKPGFVLAGFENMEYDTFTISMNSGDRIILYTDGVTEALSKEETLYGEKRLENRLNSPEVLDKETTEDIVSYIKEDISVFADGAEQADDITIMLLKIK